MVKPFKNLLLQNRQTDFYETWHVASGTPAHHSLLKWWRWSDLDLFYGKVKFGNLGFSIGKVETVDFPETIAASDLTVGRSRHLIEYMKVCEYWRSMSVLDLGLRSCAYKNSNRIFSETTVPTWTNFLWKFSGTGKWKSDDMMLVTCPRWPPRPYMVKPFKNLLLWNQRAYFHETRYVAWETPAHHSLFKWWPWSDPDLFLLRSNLVT